MVSQFSSRVGKTFPGPTTGSGGLIFELFFRRETELNAEVGMQNADKKQNRNLGVRN